MSLFKPGENCWKVCDNTDGNVLIDGKEYFEHLYDSLKQAERSVFLMGWDINSKITLKRDGKDTDNDAPVELLAFLNYLVEETETLNVYLLCWDFTPIMLISREALQAVKFGWMSHDRIHFFFDNQHPLGACHHEKIVVIDDKQAYCGGIDLTAGRWDTHDHTPDDPGRINPWGRQYNPFHDVQCCVTGRAAGELGAYFRKRWERATGNRLEKPSENTSPPEHSRGDKLFFQKTQTAIMRTYPAYLQYDEVREIEQMYLDLINAAEEYIYMENQYITSRKTVQALCKRLKRPDSPEVVIVMPEHYRGWLEQQTLGRLQKKLLSLLKFNDRNGRLRVFFPEDKRMDSFITVHSKICIVDGNYIKIGSSNLSNRSMGFDTECDIVLNGEDNPETASCIEHTLCRLISGFVNRKTEEVEHTFDTADSLIEGIETVNTHEEKRLEEKEIKAEDGDIMKMVSSVDMADPEHTLGFEKKLENWITFSEKEQGSGLPWKKYIVRGIGVAVLCILFAAVYKLVMFYKAEGPEMIINQFTNSHIESVPLQWAWVMLIFAAGGLIFVPVTLLLIATVTVFSPVKAVVFTLTGTVCNAGLGYLAGYILGDKFVNRIFPKTHQAFTQKVSGRGVFSVLLVRMIPFAHFSLINVLFGAGHVGFFSFLGGTIIGIIPGIIGFLLFQKSFIRFLKEPNWGTGIKLAGIAVAVLGVFYLLRRWILSLKQTPKKD